MDPFTLAYKEVAPVTYTIDTYLIPVLLYIFIVSSAVTLILLLINHVTKSARLFHLRQHALSISQLGLASSVMLLLVSGLCSGILTGISADTLKSLNNTTWSVSDNFSLRPYKTLLFIEKGTTSTVMGQEVYTPGRDFILPVDTAAAFEAALIRNNVKVITSANGFSAQVTFQAQ